MKFMWEMLSGMSGLISSKRVCGVIGWIVCLVIACFATSYLIAVPTFLDTILLTSAGLLGLDTITNIWKSKYSDSE